uniref:Uncharacterized protein n=1 Tax=Amphimedon queenslandica TaxID=400682 RepID=A0A1X7T4R0_AMPQE
MLKDSGRYLGRREPRLNSQGGTNDVIDFWSNPGYTLSRLPMGGTTSCLATIVLPKSSSQPNTLRLFDTLKDVIGRTDQWRIWARA